MRITTFPGRKSLRAGLLAGSAFLALPLAAQAAELIVARSVDADNLDPYKTSTTQSVQATALIFDTLLTMDRSGAVKPGLAESWNVSADGKTYTLAIRDGIKCHDASPFDAGTAAWSIKRAIDPGTVNPSLSGWGPITDVKADGKVVTIALSEPYGPFPSFLASILAPVMCESSVAGAEFKPVGTGPFKLVDWVRNDRIDLEANADYRNFNPLVDNPGRPKIDKLSLRVIPEAVARMAALRSGEVQMVEPSLEEAAGLKEDPAFKVYTADLSGQQVVAAFTWKIKPLDNPDVRRAIGMAMNRNAYASIAFEGLVNVANCPVAPNLFATDEALCAGWGVEYDPEGAKALLEKAGYGPSNPLKIVLSVHKLPGWDQMHQIMQQDLAAVGVQAEIETREVAAFFDHMGSENQRTDGPPVVWTMGMSGVDPDYLYFLWHRPGFTNMGINAELDGLLNEQRKLTGDARKAKIQEAEKYLMENAYAVPLLSPGWSWLMASTADVDGFKMGFVASLLFNDVTLKQ